MRVTLIVSGGFLMVRDTYSDLGDGNLIFCCMGTICHFFTIHFFSNVIFLLEYNKVDKKQKFSAFDIFESWSKKMWLLS